MIGMNGIVASLKSHPLVLALVVMNVLFLGYIVHEVSAAGARRDAIIAEMTQDCVVAKKGDRQ